MSAVQFDYDNDAGMLYAIIRYLGECKEDKKRDTYITSIFNTGRRITMVMMEEIVQNKCNGSAAIKFADYMSNNSSKFTLGFRRFTDKFDTDTENPCKLTATGVRLYNDMMDGNTKTLVYNQFGTNEGKNKFVKFIYILLNNIDENSPTLDRVTDANYKAWVSTEKLRFEDAVQTAFNAAPPVGAGDAARLAAQQLAAANAAGASGVVAPLAAANAAGANPFDDPPAASGVGAGDAEAAPPAAAPLAAAPPAASGLAAAKPPASAASAALPPPPLLSSAARLANSSAASITFPDLLVPLKIELNGSRKVITIGTQIIDISADGSVNTDAVKQRYDAYVTNAKISNPNATKDELKTVIKKQTDEEAGRASHDLSDEHGVPLSVGRGRAGGAPTSIGGGGAGGSRRPKKTRKRRVKRSKRKTAHYLRRH